MGQVRDPQSPSAQRMRELRARDPDFDRRNKTVELARQAAFQALARQHPDDYQRLLQAELTARGVDGNDRRRKLDWPKVRQMRARYNHGDGDPIALLAADYDVDESTAANVVHHKSWRNDPEGRRS
jgi:hypothetical protein